MLEESHITIPDLKLYYRTTVTKHHGSGTETDMYTNGIEDPEIRLCNYRHLIFYKGAKDSFLKKQC
jgi:hypothetical protein